MQRYGVGVERPRRPSAIEISEDPNELSSPSSYPVKVSSLLIALGVCKRRSLQVTVEHLNATDDESKTEIVHAKFVVGADGKSYLTCALLWHRHAVCRSTFVGQKDSGN